MNKVFPVGTRVVLLALWVFALIGLVQGFDLFRSLPPAQASRLTANWNDVAAIRASNAITSVIYLPVISKNSSDPCVPIPGEGYGTVTVNPPPTGRPADQHPDLNLALRGYAPTNQDKGLVDYGGTGDPSAPQLAGLFADNRVPVPFSTVYQVYDWDWPNNRRGNLLTDWPVTLVDMAVRPGEIIHVPNSGYPISRPMLPSGYSVLVLYATTERITLKYTREDNVISGYTLHVENICVEPNLLSLYQTWNAAGRSQLPALGAGQGFGRAKGGEIGVAIRDTGSFMDPRSRKDWWQ